MDLIANNKVEFQWSESHFSIVCNYYLSLFKNCNLKYNDTFKKAVFYRHSASLLKELKNIFMVPMLINNFQEIKKHQLVESFIDFLLRLLSHKTDWMIDRCKDRVENLEKELRFLHTILGDISWMLHDDKHEEFEKLVAEFEAVANEAGNLVHSLFFCIDIQANFSVVLDRIGFLKVGIIKFLDLFLPSLSKSAKYTTPNTTAVVDSILCIFDSLVYDLEDLMNRDDNMIADAKDQIKNLQRMLVSLQSCIKDITARHSLETEELKETLMQIRERTHEAEYLIISFLVGNAPLWYLINRLTSINKKFELFGQEITKKCRFGDLILKVPKYFAAQQSLQENRINLEGDDVTIGFEEKAADILDQLLGGMKRLQVISIFGMPGIGKTTLAKKLYNHPSVNYWFDKISWCVVSQIYKRQSILVDILVHIKSELDKDKILGMEEESLVEYIYKALKGRRYLIVMDDIWDSNVWDDLRRCFPDDGNGSRILFTTRNKDVAPFNSTVYEQPFLSNDECWELLEKKVFDDKSCPLELLEIGKKIAANCNGLPLAVVVIAGVLSTMEKEKTTWEEVEGNLASYIFKDGDDTVMQILELSYKHLPDHLKPCFLYFGAFDEDKEIAVGNLIRLWIAEGFVSEEEDKTAENVAEEYLMELIDKSLVMVAKRRSDGGVKTCVIHDLLHDLCFKRSQEENLLKFVKPDFDSTFERSHSLQALNYEYVPVISSYWQHIRSFRGLRHLNSIPFYARDMRLLRALDFDYIYNHYIGIEFLVYLRYLVISDLPPSISSLVNLEYLHVTKTRKTIHINSAIMKMRKLRYIHVGSEAIYDEVCDSSHANDLEFLSGISINCREDEEMLRCSRHLRRLKCGYKVQPTTENERAYRRFDLRFLTRLESLSLAFNGLRTSFEEVTRLPFHIRKLTFSNMRLRWEMMSTIGRLENLEVLKLRVVYADGDKRWDTRDGEFQKLRFLKLETKHLDRWNVASSRHFPELRQLVLFGCRNLEEIPSEIGEIATLQLIEVKGRCTESMVESAKRIQQQQWDMGIEELRVVADCRW